MDRTIGRYSGIDRGPLVIAFGAMHGNEPAGVKALEAIFDALKNEPKNNPDFRFKGRLLGLIGNVKAYQEGVRFIEKDLNRQWTIDNIVRAKNTSVYKLEPELQELKSLLEIVENEIAEYDPEKIIVLDLHTTTAHGGIFTLPAQDQDSERIALELHILEFLSHMAFVSQRWFNFLEVTTTVL